MGPRTWKDPHCRARTAALAHQGVLGLSTKEGQRHAEARLCLGQNRGGDKLGESAAIGPAPRDDVEDSARRFIGHGVGQMVEELMGAEGGRGCGQGSGIGPEAGGVDHRLGEGRDILGRDDEAVAAGTDERLGGAAGLRGDEGEAGAGIFGNDHPPAVETARQDAAVAVGQGLGDAFGWADAETLHARQAIEGCLQRPCADNAQGGVRQMRGGFCPGPRQDIYGLAVGEGPREDKAEPRVRTRRGRGLRAGSGVGQFGHLAAAHAPAAHEVVHRAGTQPEGRNGGAVDMACKESA